MIESLHSVICCRHAISEFGAVDFYLNVNELCSFVKMCSLGIRIKRIRN